MPCPGKPSTYRVGAPVSDLLELHPSVAKVLYAPNNKGELVAAVIEATRAGHAIHAIGTNYSLSGAQMADVVIDTSGMTDPTRQYPWPLADTYPDFPGLQMHLCQPFLPGAAPLDERRLRDGGNDFLGRIAKRQDFAGRHFVWVEAGIKFRWLLEDLGRCGLALATMGAGGGQSLAGALSTATHGADFDVPPLVEWIRALHLVAPGGQEYWITPKSSIFADAGTLQGLPEWCRDTQIISNDEVFNAVRVGVGRFGVVYSMVLEVVPAYSLLEVNLEHRWSEIREQLQASRLDGGHPAGIFDNRLADLDGGWFAREVIKRTSLISDTPENYKYMGGPGVPNERPFNQRQYMSELGALGLNDIAGALRGGASMALKHINIVVALFQKDQCWVTRRWARPGALPAAGMGDPEQVPILAAVIANPTNPLGIVSAMKDELQHASDALDAIDAVLDGDIHDQIRRGERMSEFIDKDLPAIAQASADAGETSSEALFLIIYKLATDPILTKKSMPIVADRVSGIVGSDFKKLVRAGGASGGPGGNILDTHNYSLDHAQSGHSAEFFFDASGADYLRFVDDVVAIAHERAPIYGFVGIRFNPRSSALIAMQQFDMTASVEIQTARSRHEDVYAGFWDAVHATAANHRGIPHWGQELRRSAGQIASLYGHRLETWRRVLAGLANDYPRTFSTAFSRAHGLEPLGGKDIGADLFFWALEAGMPDPIRRPT